MLKEILVHLDGGAEDEVRLSYALPLVETHGASLTGVFTNELPQVVYPVDGGIYVPTAAEVTHGEAETRGRDVAARLAERLGALPGKPDLVRIDATPEAMGERVASRARSADLVIASRPMDATRPTLWRNMFEKVLFTGGRALLAVPRERKLEGGIARVTLAWNDSRQSSRALAAAMPLILQAEQISVVLIDPPLRPAGEEARPGDEVVRYLSRYGKSATLYRVSSTDKRVSEALMAEARRHKADLIVMGGYGKSSLLQWVLGGVSEEMLTHCEAPILLAN